MIALDMLPESVRPRVRDHWERLEKSLQERDQIIRDQKQRLQLQEEKIRWLYL